jgi:hypothetical protein
MNKQWEINKQYESVDILCHLNLNMRIECFTTLSLKLLGALKPDRVLLLVLFHDIMSWKHGQQLII